MFLQTRRRSCCRPPPTQSTPVAWKGSPRLLAHDEYLQRVPAGGVAFRRSPTRPNGRWAPIGYCSSFRAGKDWAVGRAVLAALDEQSQRAFLSRELPTIRVGLGALNASADGQARSGRSDDFRWQMGSLRSMGVTRRRSCLAAQGRARCLPVRRGLGVDRATYAMLDSLPEADVPVPTASRRRRRPV